MRTLLTKLSEVGDYSYLRFSKKALLLWLRTWPQSVLKSLEEVNYGKLLHLRDFPTWRDFGQSRQQLLEKREPEVSISI